MSDQDTNVFEVPDASQEVTNSSDALNDLLSTITDETGNPKYADVATALQSIPEAQSFIETLKQENKELRDVKAKTEAAEAIRGKEQPKAEAAFSTEELVKVIDQVMDTRSTQEREKDNLSTVNKKFVEVYGDKAQQKMQSLAQENGVSLDFVQQMAKTSPMAVFRLSGIQNQEQGTPSKSTSTINTEAFTTPAPGEKPKPVMSGASTKDMVNLWKWAGTQVKP
jgi:hypothetical protein